MSFADWNSGITVTSPKQPSGVVCMSTVDDLSYTPSAEEQSRDAAQIMATGRRSWKTLKGRGEAVWPPHLEAALIEALERYQPDTSRSVKSAGRFPMRNRFISDYIFEITGKRRTPKQVGSRLQQLRDTCKGQRILQLISRRDPYDDSRAGSSSATSEHSPGPAPISNFSHHDTPPPQRTVVYVVIAMERSSWSAPPVVHFVSNTKSTPLLIRLAGTRDMGYGGLNGSPPSSVLRSLEPLITFASASALTLQSTFTVLVDNDNTPIRTEVVPLKCHSSPVESSGWLYSTALVPGFWKYLVDRSSDATRYTIMQTITPIRHHQRFEDQFGRVREFQDPTSSITVVYRFRLPEEGVAAENPMEQQNFVQNYNHAETSLTPTSEIAHFSDSSQWSPLHESVDWRRAETTSPPGFQHHPQQLHPYIAQQSEVVTKLAYDYGVPVTGPSYQSTCSAVGQDIYTHYHVEKVESPPALLYPAVEDFEPWQDQHSYRFSHQQHMHPIAPPSHYLGY